jgi:hypothetical protein
LDYILITEVEKVLQTYSLEEIWEHNSLTDEDVLRIILEQVDLEIPVKPVDYDEEASS